MFVLNLRELVTRTRTEWVCSFFLCFCFCLCCSWSHRTQLLSTGFACVYVASRYLSLTYTVFRLSDCCIKCCKDRLNLRNNCFSSHIARNNPSAEKRRNYTAHNILLCPILYVWQNHKYFNNVQMSMRTLEKHDLPKQRNWKYSRV